MDHSRPHSDLSTIAVHAGRDDLTPLGVHALPIDLSTTYPVGDCDEAAETLDSWTRGEQPKGSPIYARLHNPTVARFEDALAELEQAPAAVAFATGMAALTAVLLSLPADRRHVVGVRPLYGTTDHLLGSELLGIKVSWADPDTVAAAITPRTGLVMIETPQNPTTGLVDIAAIVAQAGDVPVMVDNTFATPVLQNPMLQGASAVLHSATKFIGGHGDAMGGIVATSEEWAARLRQVRIATGALLHPLGAYHLHRGIATLPLRVHAMQRTATELAQRLAAHPQVAQVWHPSLPGADPLSLVGTQMRGPGSMLAMEIAGGLPAVRALLSSVELMTHAVSLGSTDTLIQHPASLTHRILDANALDSGGISAGLVRMSVGLESADDLWDDLTHALEHAATAAATHSV